MASERKRCPACHPGTGGQCGLREGHDRDHTLLIPSNAPWFPRTETPTPTPEAPHGE